MKHLYALPIDTWIELQNKRDELADEVERLAALQTENVDDERRAFADLERAREDLAEFDASPEGQALAIAKATGGEE